MNTQRARSLRNNLTDAELKCWPRLRMRQVRGLKFRRQHPLGPYVVDFVCLERRLIIEVDGGQHAEQSAQDGRREEYLAGLGFETLRFWNNAVLTEADAILEVIAQALKNRICHPSDIPSAKETLE